MKIAIELVMVAAPCMITVLMLVALLRRTRDDTRKHAHMTRADVDRTFELSEMRELKRRVDSRLRRYA